MPASRTRDNASLTRGERARASSRARTGESAVRFFTRNQLVISLVPITIIVLANGLFPADFALRPLHPKHLPTLDPTLHVTTWPGRFLFISYRDQKTGLCLKGPDDVYIVVFWVFVWLAARDLLMRYALDPMARLLSIRDVKDRLRFGEQGWSVAYYSVFWSLGFHILRTSQYGSLLGPSLWRGYPHFALTPLTKFYYLVQTSFWLQQLLVINIEKRRKDYVQMSIHHVITIVLVIASYAGNFTRIGTAILCVMDFSDIFLSLAKMLKYANSSLCDPTFGFFMLSWIVTRHYLFSALIKSVLSEAPKWVAYRWDPAGGFFFTRTTHFGFVALLSALEVLMCIWFYSICRVAWRTIRGHGAEDIRSDESSCGLAWTWLIFQLGRRARFPRDDRAETCRQRGHERTEATTAHVIETIGSCNTFDAAENTI